MLNLLVDVVAVDGNYETFFDEKKRAFFSHVTRLLLRAFEKSLRTSKKSEHFLGFPRLFLFSFSITTSKLDAFNCRARERTKKS